MFRSLGKFDDKRFIVILNILGGSRNIFNDVVEFCDPTK